jgi:hypothetical protein
MKKFLTILMLSFGFHQQGIALPPDFILNNGVISPFAPVSFPGNVTISFDFYVENGSYTFSNDQLSNDNAVITFSFTKLNPSGIAPTGPGANLFTWVLSNNAGTGSGKVYTYTGTTKNVLMNQSPPATKYKIIFSNVPITLGATIAENDVRVAGQFTDPGNAPTGHSANNSFSAATYTVAAAPVPVTLVGLAGVYKNGMSQLSWSTSSEINLGKFEIERSGDGQRYSSLGTVVAKGNSSSNSVYGFNDLMPLSGANYYRLKMIDMDQTARYSNTVKLNVNIKGIFISDIYPNPITDKLKFYVYSEAAQPVQVRITDYLGRVMRRETFKASGGSSNFTLAQLGALSSGIYFVEISAGEYRKIIKLEK